MTIKVIIFICYSEENVWKLCEDVALRIPDELDSCYVVFISNSCRTVPLWRQRAGREEDRLVIWVCNYLYMFTIIMYNRVIKTIL